MRYLLLLRTCALPPHCAFNKAMHLCALFLSTVILGAQQTPQSTDAPVPTKFQVFLWEKYTPPGAHNSDTPAGDYVPPSFRFVDSSGISHPVGAVDRRFSPEHEILGDHLVFVNETTSPTGEGTTRIPVGEVRLPANCKSVLLLFFPRENAASEQYNIVAIPAGAGDIPHGSLLTLNISKEPIAVMVGTEKWMLDPGGGQLVSIRHADNAPLPLLVAARDNNGNWGRRHRKQLTIDQQTSNLLLVYRTGNRYRSIVLQNQLGN